MAVPCGLHYTKVERPGKTLLAGEKFEDFETHFRINKSEIRHQLHPN
jgi:hypothetical protein